MAKIPKPVCEFDIEIDPTSTHWVKVSFFSSRKEMHKFRRLVLTSDKTPTKTSTGLCVQIENILKSQGCIAHVILNAEDLSLSAIVHELSHAVYHRNLILGAIHPSVEEDERTAYHMGELVEFILLKLLKQTTLKVHIESFMKGSSSSKATLKRNQTLCLSSLK